MNQYSNLPWDPLFYQQLPMYQPLLPLAQVFSGFTQWPGLQDYQALLDSLPEPIMTAHGQALTIVEQDGKPGHFEQHYAPRIYLSGELQTRRENWHDFFQFLSWILFPRTKAVINALHIPRARARIENDELGRRSRLENMLSLFDEGGAVILASDPTLLDLIRDFGWKQLFWQRRDELAEKLQCITFGHALYKKGLAPYIGMTANTILLPAPAEILASDMAQQLRWVDAALVAVLQQGEEYQKPKDLSPFPLLGLPGWDSDNGQEGYYDNQNYFRPGRR